MRIDILGEIVGNGMKFYDGDFCPQDFKELVANIQDDEQVDIHITSPGGSVIDGNVIVSAIRELQSSGHLVVSYVHGIAASMASVIACACDELHIDANAVLMIHLPFSCVEGNANDMKKEAELLDMMTKSLVSVYRSKFNKSDDEIVQMLTNETWILGEESSTYGLKCVVENGESEPLKIAAKYQKIFKNIPKRILNMEKEEIEKSPEEIEKVGDEVLEETVKEEPTKEEEKEEVQEIPEEEKEEPKEDTPVVESSEEDNEEKEEPKEDEEVLNKDEVLAKFAEYEKQIEELKQANDELQKKLDECEKPDEETVTKDECEKRVSGMQSKMQAQINDFTSQLKVRDEELRTVKAELTRLNGELEKSSSELSAMASALDEKNNALASLNAGVLKPAEEVPTMKEGLAKCNTPAEKVAFLKSGKYVR